MGSDGLVRNTSLIVGEEFFNNEFKSGGLLISNLDEENRTVNVVDSYFYGLVADVGGAIHINSFNTTVKNCTFENNLAKIGGAISIYSA